MTWDSEQEMYDVVTGAHQDPCEENPCDACVRHLASLSPRDRVLSDISVERERQLAKWGPQSHPDGTSGGFALARDHARTTCDENAALGNGTWLDILREEAFEAFAEVDAAALRKELVQVAAVATAWIEDIDARGKRA